MILLDYYPENFIFPQPEFGATSVVTIFFPTQTTISFHSLSPLSWCRNQRRSSPTRQLGNGWKEPPYFKNNFSPSQVDLYLTTIYLTG